MNQLSMIIRICDCCPEKPERGEIRIYADAWLELFEDGDFVTSYRYKSGVPL